MNRRTLALGLLGLALMIAPWLVKGHVLSILIVILFFAYVGQAWNVMMGFAGQLSLGHTLYVGLGAYTAGALFVHYQVSPWIGLFAAVAVAAAAGGIIGFLGFRFRIQGVYFALLTIAFAEFTRILFAHFQWVGATGGLFLPVANRDSSDLWTLRGDPVMFYYLLLILAAGVLALCRWLLHSRLGYAWLAVREDPEAAEALGIDVFRTKMAAVLISAALTGVAGVVFAFYYNNLFPSQMFSMERSIEYILAPIIGGLGTLFGPILGAFLLTALGESVTGVTEALGLQLAGVELLVYGFVLLAVVKFLPGGVWPPLARRFGLDRED